MSTNFLRAQAAQKPETGSFAASPVPSQSERTFRNHHQWRAIAEFLDAQHLASFGLRRLPAREVAAQRQGPACGMGPLREAHPVGNTGITSLLTIANHV